MKYFAEAREVGDKFMAGEIPPLPNFPDLEYLGMYSVAYFSCLELSSNTNLSREQKEFDDYIERYAAGLVTFMDQRRAQISDLNPMIHELVEILNSHENLNSEDYRKKLASLVAVTGVKNKILEITNQIKDNPEILF